MSLTSKALKTSSRWAIGNGINMPKSKLTLTRSLWCVSANSSNKTVLRALPTSKTCSCCKMHTEGNGLFVDLKTGMMYWKIFGKVMSFRG